MARYGGKFHRLQDVPKKASTMAVDYLLRTEFAGVSDPKKLADLTGMSEHNAGLMLRRQNVMLQDLMELCECRGIDFAVTLRMPDGREVTFVPDVNFGVSDARQSTREAKE